MYFQVKYLIRTYVQDILRTCIAQLKETNAPVEEYQQDFGWHFSKKDMQVTNKYILKTQHKALAIWKDKSKSWYHFTFTKMIKITVVAKEYKKLGPSHFLWDSLFHALLMLCYTTFLSYPPNLRCAHSHIHALIGIRHVHSWGGHNNTDPRRG